MDLSTKRVVVTGGAGFLGHFVCQRLRDRGCREILVPRRADYDLTTESGVARMYADMRPEVVLHLAAEVGGIGANMMNPGRYFFANMAMALHLIEHARINGLEKFLQVGTICAYPKFTPVPFREEELWSGFPEETNAPYGIAKLAQLVQAQANREQYGQNVIYLMPTNLYGPNDKFHPAVSHVIPALMKKCVDAVEAGDDHIEVWGTGRATREFLYVDDAAEGILLAAELYDGPEPVNLGADTETPISELVEQLVELVEFPGELRWDTSRPDGQPRRRVDPGRAAAEFGFEAQVPLDEGLARTLEWYRDHRDEAEARPV